MQTGLSFGSIYKAIFEERLSSQPFASASCSLDVIYINVISHILLWVGDSTHSTHRTQHDTRYDSNTQLASRGQKRVCKGSHSQTHMGSTDQSETPQKWTTWVGRCYVVFAMDTDTSKHLGGRVLRMVIACGAVIWKEGVCTHLISPVMLMVAMPYWPFHHSFKWTRILEMLHRYTAA